jgi:hypothetical protein
MGVCRLPVLRQIATAFESSRHLNIMNFYISATFCKIDTFSEFHQ